MKQLRKFFAGGWRRPEMLILVMAGAVPLSFATWNALLNNFVIERAGFTGAEIGILQSLREVPGFMAFAAVFILILMREQTLALASLLLLGIGTAMTGWFPSVIGLYCTTVLMSLGYHYYATMQKSLVLQWTPLEKTPEMLGRVIAVGSATSIVTFGIVWLAFDFAALDFHWVYMIGGGLTALAALVCWIVYPRFTVGVEQHRHLVFRRRYWLFYLLSFMGGARRQIFIVFAGFLMVEKFGFEVIDITLLFLLNATINMWLAPRVGRLVARWGERRALIFEYIGLIGVFIGYALVENATLAAGLYVLDHLFFALALAINSYFQKIADPADIASTAGVSFSIDHTAAVTVPVVLGFLWLTSPAMVFLAGSAMAAFSLLLACNVPARPSPGNETLFSFGRKPILEN
ncbi:MAG: MFS transporter [Proteobacteria bacterium]|nr:MFS transporter [Pseudomonadota bacterium]